MTNLKQSAVMLIAALSLFGRTAGAQSSAGDYAVSNTLHIGGEGRWDYISVDADHRLYLTRSTHTHIVEAASGKILGDIAGGSGLHGVAVVPTLHRGYITDGKAGKLIVFNTGTLKAVGTIDAADDADGIIYDAKADRILVACGDAAQMLALKPTADVADAKVQKIDLDGKPESLVVDGAGHAFVCLADKNLIAEVDLAAGKVVHRWPCGVGEEPTGLAIDAKQGRLFVGCRNQKLIVLGTQDGKVLAELPIGQGNDACAFDAGTGDAFASCGDGTVTVIAEKSAGAFSVKQTIQTARGARTMTVDESTHTLYLPTADFKPGDTGKRPAMVPDTFKVVVVSRSASK